MCKNSTSTEGAVTGECLYPCGNLVNVYGIPPQGTANFFLSLSCKGTIKNIHFASSTVIHGCAGACSVTVRFTILGIAGVSGALLALKHW